MAAIEETRPKVEERPATHHKKAQTYLLALAIFMIVVFAISAYSKMTNTAPKLFATEDAPQPRMQEAPPKAHPREFAEDVAKAKAALIQSLSQSPPPTPSASTSLLHVTKAPVATQGLPWPKDYTPPAPSSHDQRSQELVYASRMENLTVNLGFGTTSDSTPAPASPVVAPTPADSIDAEIARVQQLRNSILTQGPSSRGASPFSLEPSAVLSASPPSPQQSPPSAPPSVVGQSQSSQTPLPGQKLLPLTTIIRAVLDQKAMSDYVGPMRLVVVDDVYDVANHHVLIPKGSRVLAQSLLVGNINAPIQSRLGIAVKQMVLPNGQSIDFSRQAALDREGIAAVKGSTDYHLLEQLLGVAAYALLSAGSSRQGSGISNNSTFSGDVGESAREQFRPLVARYLSLVPTITLEPGTPLRIFLQEEMWITPWKAVGHRFVAGRS